MAKKIAIDIDVNSEEVTFAGGELLTLTEKVKALRKELQRVPEGTKEWTTLNKAYNENKDALDRINVKSKELFGTMSLLPGKIGDVSNQLDNAINSFKIFSSIKPTDLSSNLKELGNDFKDIFTWIGKVTGITKVYTVLNNALSKSFVNMGVAEGVAATGARALAAALTAIGIGALIVGVGLLIQNWDTLSDSIMGVTKEQKLYNEVAKKTVELSANQVTELELLTDRVKKGGASFKEKKDILSEYNKKFGETLGTVKSYKELEEKVVANLPKYISYLEAKGKAEAIYQLILESSKKKAEELAKQPQEFLSWYEKLGNAVTGLDILGFDEKMAKENKDEAIGIISETTTSYKKLWSDAITDQYKLANDLNIPPDNTKATNEAIENLKRYKEEIDKLYNTNILLEKQYIIERTKIREKAENDIKKLDDTSYNISNVIEYIKERSRIERDAYEEELKLRTVAQQEEYNKVQKHYTDLINAASGNKNKIEAIQIEADKELNKLQKKFYEDNLNNEISFDKKLFQQDKDVIEYELATLKIRLENREITQEEYDNALIKSQLDVQDRFKDIFQKYLDLVPEMGDIPKPLQELINEQDVMEAKILLDKATLNTESALKKQEYDLKVALQNKLIKQEEYDIALLELKKKYEKSGVGKDDVQLEINQKKLEQALQNELNALELSYAKKLITKEQYEYAKLQIDENYATSQNDIDNIRIERIKLLSQIEEDATNATIKRNQVIAQSWIDLGNNISNTIADTAKVLQDGSDLQKAFAITSVLINSAASIGKVVLDGQQTLSDYRKAIATGNATAIQGQALITNPATAPIGAGMMAAGKIAAARATAGLVKTKITEGLQIGSIVATTAAQIAAITNAKSAGGSSGANAGGDTGAGGPSFSQGPGIGAPVVTGLSQEGQISSIVANSIAQNNSQNRPLKAYVVGNDVTTQQQLDRRLRSLARL